jgi:hypothetical protein
VKHLRLYIALILILSIGSAATAAEGRSNLIEYSAQPIIVKALYSEPLRLLSGVGKIGANGAVGENSEIAPEVNVESQRWGADLVQAALAMHNDPGEGIKVILYGLNCEQEDGSFGAENDFQHISFFLEAAARTLILLKQSGDKKYASLVAESTMALERAARHFIMSGDMKKQQDKGKTFTHRYYLLAAALGEIATLTQDKELSQKAEECAEQGLECQLPDGTNPEKGGFDVNYNAASGLFAERYYLICTNPKVRSKLKEMIRKTLEREAQAVMPNGDLSIADSTRTGRDLKHDQSGHKKGLDHKSIIQAFVLGSTITDEPKFSEIAQKIATYRGWWR